MDNLTHSLVGWAIAETGLGKRTRKGLAASVMAANLPDIDVFFGWAPWPPLAMHRGFTHGLVGGVLVLPALLAALLWLFDRWQTRHGGRTADAPPMRFAWLTGICYLAALTHPLLDLQNVYAIQLLSPASERWFHTDGLFIVSPWLLALLAVGIRGSRCSGRGRPAILALSGVLAFILANMGISALAWRAPLVGEPHRRPERIFAAPEPIAFWRRDVVWRQDGEIMRGRYDPVRNLTELVALGDPVPDRMADPVVTRAINASGQARKFLAWAQLPVAQVRAGRCHEEVIFGDARFTGPGMSRNFNVAVELPLGHEGCGGF